MAFQKGQSGNPGGRPKDKPFAEALRLEIAAAGDDHKELRAIARTLLGLAKSGELQAIQQVADRLDGKPAQESTLTVRNELDSMNDSELRELIRRELAGLGGSGITDQEQPNPPVTH